MRSSYLLDTDVIILFLKNHPKVVGVISSIQDQDLAISVLSIGEITEGLTVRSVKKTAGFKQFLKTVRIVPIDQIVAEQFGLLRHTLRAKNALIGDIDTLIAATCLAHHAILVTNNHNHYQRVPNLKLLTP